MNTAGAAPASPAVTQPAASSNLPSRLKQAAILCALTILAVLVHGYHPMVEDAEIYVPSVARLLNPALYPHDYTLFTGQTRLSLFPQIVAASVRISHIPLEWALFLWHVFSILLFLAACWRFLGNQFPQMRIPWFGVAVIASLLTLPVAGTSLYIMDQYLTARSLSTPFALWAISEFARRKWIFGLLWIALTFAAHPLMAAFVIAYVVISSVVGVASALNFSALVGVFLLPGAASYREATNTRSYLFLGRWEWYEWIGALAPLVVLWWFFRLGTRNKTAARVGESARGLSVFGLLFLVIGIAISFVPALTGLVRFQPMRGLHLIYILMFLFAGGLLWQFVIRERSWLGVVILLPLCAAMFYVQRQEFPATEHIEGPWLSASNNDWVQAFVWIREHTPPDAYFALDPRYMELQGEDEHGFRALAQRSRLADWSKDPGAVTINPDLAEVWREQVRAASNWRDMGDAGILRLKRDLGVDWVVLAVSTKTNLDCRFRNSAVQICHVQ